MFKRSQINTKATIPEPAGQPWSPLKSVFERDLCVLVLQLMKSELASS